MSLTTRQWSIVGWSERRSVVLNADRLRLRVEEDTWVEMAMREESGREDKEAKWVGRELEG